MARNIYALYDNGAFSGEYTAGELSERLGLKHINTYAETGGKALNRYTFEVVGSTANVSETWAREWDTLRLRFLATKKEGII